MIFLSARYTSFFTNSVQRTSNCVTKKNQGWGTSVSFSLLCCFWCHDEGIMIIIVICIHREIQVREPLFSSHWSPPLQFHPMPSFNVFVWHKKKSTSNCTSCLLSRRRLNTAGKTHSKWVKHGQQYKEKMMEARKERKNEWIGCNEGVFASLVASSLFILDF